jgi:hypothetical protein
MGGLSAQDPSAPKTPPAHQATKSNSGKQPTHSPAKQLSKSSAKQPAPASKTGTTTHAVPTRSVSATSSPPHSTTQTAKPATTSTATRRHTTQTTGKKPVAAAPRRSSQQQPTPDRYKEIQQALADRGYFSGAPDGTWGPESAEAMKRFQRDQNLTEDGKIGSLSLIALGLGPKRVAAVAPIAVTPSVDSVPEPSELASPGQQ